MDIKDFLGIERVGATTWRFEVTERLITPGLFLYGGCGLASGVEALEEATGRPTIYAAAHYLSFAPLGAVATVEVNVAVVGKRVTQARATTSVEGREILTVNAALGVGDLDAPAAWTRPPDVPPPADCPVRSMPRRVANSIFDHLETRVARGRTFDQLDGTPGSPQSALWVRLPNHLEPSAGTLAIVGDLVSGGTSEPLGRQAIGRSLDNTIRAATLVPTEWVLCDIHVHALHHGFAQGIGFLWSEDGTLLGTASQSMSVKFWEPAPPEDSTRLM